MMCVRTTTFFIIVNGQPMGQIFPYRGIRQGDPISPYLFIIYAEVLSSLLTQADRNGSLRGVPTSKKGWRINHLFFPDDSLLFYRTDTNHWQRLNNILQLYEGASGQKLNANKTATFFNRNILGGEKEAVIRLAAIPETKRYDSYPGLPTLVGKSQTKEFMAIAYSGSD
jgi:hypothetical protein